MTPTDILTFYPTQDAAAKAIGVTQGAVSQWRINGSIPYLRQLAYQKATRGKLKASLDHAPMADRKRAVTA